MLDWEKGIPIEERKMVTVGDVTINYPMCEHSETYKKIRYERRQEFAKTLIERQNGLCYKCFHRKEDTPTP